MKTCKKCEEDIEKTILTNFILGDGICEKHGGFSIHHENLKILCENCAIELKKCQICGKIIDEKTCD